MGKVPFLLITIFGSIGPNSIAVAQNINLILASGLRNAGHSVDLPISIVSKGGVAVAGLQWSLTYSKDITSITVAIGASSMSAHKALSCNGRRCQIIGLNHTTIPDGVVAIATVQFAMHPSRDAIPIKITDVFAVSPEGHSVPATAFFGSVLGPGGNDDTMNHVP